jgi:hypothetical protein
VWARSIASSSGWMVLAVNDLDPENEIRMTVGEMNGAWLIGAVNCAAPNSPTHRRSRHPFDYAQGRHESGNRSRAGVGQESGSTPFENYSSTNLAAAITFSGVG